MRIIAGEFKRRNLFSVPGNTARPTTDYTRESLFSIIGDCEGKSFLDLYSGSGAVGLEALSRGASRSVFVEFSYNAIDTIKKNIELLGCRERSKIYRRKVNSYLAKAEEAYDIVFMDPPYEKGLVKLTLQELSESSALNDDTLIIIEHSVKEKIPLEWQDWIIQESKTKHSQLTFLTPGGKKNVESSEVL
ncbi:MAG: 16S rRNA (guanine(966)-N(2))-methyltransferase RsmD [Candidatus Cloacimonetes bacterium]|nr:16S rRNA (guanine(966)-N(2))-methyltransferase RsmD [Candidatus Cloacimonadota bacterium]